MKRIFKNILLNLVKRQRTVLFTVLILIATMGLMACANVNVTNKSKENTNEKTNEKQDKAETINEEPADEKPTKEKTNGDVLSSDNFITGVDISSYLSVRDSGVIFKDENGEVLDDEAFFARLRKGGTNWVRIRVWNDPYDSNQRGYGGGNSDIEKALTIGKLATDAGMRVLIDFHYSDFWADPSKYQVPKKWEDMNIDDKAEALCDFTQKSLEYLISEGVDVGMVQIGNETNNGICGENEWENMASLFEAGSRAVREIDSQIMIALHFTDPQKGLSQYAEKLESYNIDYDVFASSYYPFWHGTTQQLSDELSALANTYNKKVMIAETSWAYTELDGDGHQNTAPSSSGTKMAYDISAKGQIDEIRDVVNTVRSVDGGIGVFYWEPAWISPNNVYADGKNIDKGLLEKNKKVWEAYGSGWASSYAAEYDPKDAGVWYGGSAVDNQAWFDFEGKALESVDSYALVKEGLCYYSVVGRSTRCEGRKNMIN